MLLFYLNLRGFALVSEHRWLCFFLHFMVLLLAPILFLRDDGVIGFRIQEFDHGSSSTAMTILTWSTEQFVKKYSTLFVDLSANRLLGIHYIELVA